MSNWEKPLFVVLMVAIMAQKLLGPTKIEKEFARNHICPDLLKVAPVNLLTVKYPISNKVVNFGNKLGPRFLQDSPILLFDADPTEFHTIFLLDADAPDPGFPTDRAFNHWTVVNIPGCEIIKGEVLVEYIAPIPLKNSGYHRFVFLVYKQRTKLDFSETYIDQNNGDREKFFVEEFALKYELGNPIAGNFFQAHYDKSVLELRKKLDLSH